MVIYIFNGPNLNVLGKRDASLYGGLSMEQVMLELQVHHPDVQFVYKQSNHEGDLIDWLQQPLFEEYKLPDSQPAGIVLNAGGYTHTSVALRDAVALSPVPVVEVHITDIYHREPFRQISLLTDVCAHSIIGHGPQGYAEAVEWIINKNK